MYIYCKASHYRYHTENSQIFPSNSVKYWPYQKLFQINRVHQYKILNLCHNYFWTVCHSWVIWWRLNWLGIILSWNKSKLYLCDHSRPTILNLYYQKCDSHNIKSIYNKQTEIKNQNLKFVYIPNYIPSVLHAMLFSFRQELW